MRKQFGMELRLQKTDYILYIDSDGQIGPNQFDEMWRRRSENLFLMGLATRASIRRSGSRIRSCSNFFTECVSPIGCTIAG